MNNNNQSYKTIGEVAQEIGLINKKNKKLNTHTLRFWERHFKQIKPKVLAGNRRYYSNKDIEYLKLIYKLLKNKGFTINGAKKALNDPSLKLDDHSTSSVNKKNLKKSLRIKARNIKNIIKKIKSNN
jgi:Predicted transcriptional regulators